MKVPQETDIVWNPVYTVSALALGRRARLFPLSLVLLQITKVPENLLPFAVQCRNLTVSNTRTILLTPEIYVDQNIHEQLVELMLEAIQGARE